MMNYQTKQTSVVQRQRTESSLSMVSGMSQLSAVVEYAPGSFVNDNTDGVNDNVTRHDLDEDQNKNFNRVMFNLEQDQSQLIKNTQFCNSLQLHDEAVRDTGAQTVGLQGSRNCVRNCLSLQCHCQGNHQCCRQLNIEGTCFNASERHPAPVTLQSLNGCSGSGYLVPHIGHGPRGLAYDISNQYESIPDIIDPSLRNTCVEFNKKNYYITATSSPINVVPVLPQRQSYNQLYNDDIQTNQGCSVHTSEYSAATIQKRCVRTKHCCFTGWKKRMLNCYGPGFVLLCVLNIILIMTNVVGLPFLYVSRHLKYSNSVAERPSIRSHGCENYKDLLDTSFADITSKFCLKPLTELIEIINKYTHDMKESITDAYVEKPKFIEKVPENQAHIQLKAVNWTKYGSKNHSVVLWEHLPTNYNGIILTNDKVSVRVNTSGYYFMYLRVHYRKPKFIAESLQLSIGNAVVKKEHPSDLELDSIRHRCFPTNASEDIDQFINMEFLQYFKATDTIYIKIHNMPTFFLADNTLFGMFFI